MKKGSQNSSMPRSTAETLKQIQQKQGLSISLVSTDAPKSSFPLDTPVSKEMRPKQNVTLDKTPKPPSRSSVTTDSKAALSQVRSVANPSTAETRTSSGQPNQPTFQDIKMATGLNKTGTPISTATEPRAFGSQSWSNPSPLLATETKAQGIANRANQSSEGKIQGGSGRLSQNSAILPESKAQAVKLFQTDNKSQGRISQASTHAETKSQVNVSRSQSQLSFEGKVPGGLSRNPLNSPPLEVKVMGNSQGRPSQNFSAPQHENKTAGNQRGLSHIVVDGKTYNTQTKVIPNRSADVKTPNTLRVSQTMKSTPVSTAGKLVLEQPTGNSSSLNPFRASTTKVTSTAEEKSMFKVTRTSQIVAENQTAGHSKVSQNFSMHSQSKAVSQVVKISSASSDPSLKTPVTFDNIADSTANPVLTTMPSTRGSVLKRSPVSKTLNSTPVAKKKCTKRASPNTPEQSGKNQQTPDSVGFFKGLPCDVTVTPVANNRQGNVTYETIAIPSTSGNSKKNVGSSSNSSIITACPACGQVSLNLNYCHSCQNSIPSSAQVYQLQRAPQTAVPSFVSTKIVTTSTIQKKIYCQIPDMMGTNQTIQFQQEKVMIGPSPVIQVSPRARGRGRSRKKFVEPVCYTLSSDEEEPVSVPFNPILEEATGNAAHFFPVESEGSKSEHSSASEIMQDENQDFDDQFPGVTDINEDMLNDDEDPDEEEMEFEDEGLEAEDEEEEADFLSEGDEDEESHHEEDNDEDGGQLPTDYPLRCRSIRIGSYKIHPRPNVQQFLPVTLQTDSISFHAPSLSDPHKDVLITLRNPDIIKVYVHFGRCLPILYVFTTATFGENVRNGLQMSQNDCSVYFDPMSKDDKTQKLTFLIEMLHDDQKRFLRHIFPGDKKCIEIDQKTANEILVKSTPNQTTSQILRLHADTPQVPTPVENQIPQTIATPSQLSVTKVILPPQPVVKLLTYPPPPQTGGITVTNEDLLCLNEGEFLNDAIIDFYLKYVFYEKLSPYHREKTHIFSSYFYPRLTHKPERPRPGDDPTKTMQVRRHNQVKTWTRHVDIFSKDYIIIPVNQNVHWFLAIICYPGHVPDAPNVPAKPESKVSKPVDNVTSTDEQEVSSKVVIKELSGNGESDSNNQDDNSMTSSLNSPYEVEEPPDSDDPSVETPDSSTHPDGKQRKEMPCICIFDSLSGPNRWRIAATLREYLEMEWKMKKGTKKVFDRNTMAGFIMKCPQQTNYSDCGMYLLQFVESFFENPIPYFGNPMPDLTNWFSELKISKKRQQLKDLIISIQKKQQAHAAGSSARKINQLEGVQSSPKTVQQQTDNR